MDPEHIVITCNDAGAIDGAALFRSQADDAFEAAKSRALMVGSSKFYVFRVVHGLKDKLTFEPITKPGRS